MKDCPRTSEHQRLGGGTPRKSLTQAELANGVFAGGGWPRSAAHYWGYAPYAALVFEQSKLRASPPNRWLRVRSGPHSEEQGTFTMSILWTPVPLSPSECGSLRDPNFHKHITPSGRSGGRTIEGFWLGPPRPWSGWVDASTIPP